MDKPKEIPSIEIKPMPKNQRMKQLIESLIKLEQCDLKRMSEEGRMHLKAIWNLLGQPTQEAFKPKAKNEQ